MTLEEWVEKNAPQLRDNLKSSIGVYCRGVLSEEDQETLLRINLIMVREWIREMGKSNGGKAS